jgi:RHS repeat-associated protein
VQAEFRTFDAFGKARDNAGGDSLNGNLFATNPNGKRNRKGFTGHEHLDEVGLIHMNGRAYDYNLGRFYGVDPIIQFPTNSQSLNGYSYLMNNPLAGTDPTGYCEAATGTHIKDCNYQVTTSYSNGTSSTVNRLDIRQALNRDQSNNDAIAANGASNNQNTSQKSRTDGYNSGPNNVGNSADTRNGWPESYHDSFDSQFDDYISDMVARKEMSESDAMDVRAVQAGNNARVGAIIVGGSVGAALGIGYLALMGEAAAEIYAGVSAGMGIYALAVNGGASTAVIAGGLEGAYMAANGIPGTGPGFAGMAAVTDLKVASQGFKLYHGTSPVYSLALLNGAELNAATAAASKIDGPLGFFLATQADDAFFFAARRNSGTILEYSFSGNAVKALNGLPTSPIANPAKGFLRFNGEESIIQPSQFEVFNILRKNGEIMVRPLQ